MTVVFNDLYSLLSALASKFVVCYSNEVVIELNHLLFGALLSSQSTNRFGNIEGRILVVL